MKIRKGYVLEEIGGISMVLYAGSEPDKMNGVINLNGIGVFIWKQLEKGCSMENLLREITTEYEVDEETARRDTEAFLITLRSENILLDECE